jgi:hypothetical protein
MIEPPVHDLQAVCPFCGERHNAVTAVQYNTDRFYPEDGDISLCFQCGRFSLYDSDKEGGLRRPTASEQHELDHNKHCRDMLTAWKTIKLQN